MLPVTATRAESSADIHGAIRAASRATGTSFDYLLKTAQRESSLDPAARARTSSATGLFQFTEGTWLATMKREGAALGYGRYADAIARTPSGRHEVADPKLRREILALREDPVASALMAGAYSRQNAGDLQRALGRAPNEGELYLAHFLGPAGATRFIAAADARPNGRADRLFPEAARANREIFYTRDGTARTVADVKRILTARHDTTAAVAPQRPLIDAATAEAATPPAAYAPAQDKTFSFDTLFQPGRAAPVADGVKALWGPRTASAGAPLDLGQFLRPSVRASLTAA